MYILAPCYYISLTLVFSHSSRSHYAVVVCTSQFLHIACLAFSSPIFTICGPQSITIFFPHLFYVLYFLPSQYYLFCPIFESLNLFIYRFYILQICTPLPFYTGAFAMKMRKRIFAIYCCLTVSHRGLMVLPLWSHGLMVSLSHPCVLIVQFYTFVHCSVSVLRIFMLKHLSLNFITCFVYLVPWYLNIFLIYVTFSK